MKYRTYFPPSVIRYDPKEIWEALPEETRKRIHIEDFRNLLTTLEDLHVIYALTHRAKDAARYVKTLEEFEPVEAS